MEMFAVSAYYFRTLEFIYSILLKVISCKQFIGYAKCGQ